MDGRNQVRVWMQQRTCLAAVIGLVAMPVCGLITGCAGAAAPAAAVAGTSSATTGYPKDAGTLNVRDFGAKGDGVTDDTAAILSAIAASGGDTGTYIWQDQFVYFPDGTYIISAPLVKRYASGGFASGMVLMGQSQANTILKLKDNAAGYKSTTAPQAMIFTTAKLLDGSPTSGGKNYTTLGEGNDAYNNKIESMTVNVGIGNPGAIGIDYLASNMGSIRNVTVTAPQGSGTTGIAMTRKWIGPALLEHVTVKGFNVGIDVANLEYGITLNHVQISGPTTAGLRNSQNMISSNDLIINSQGPAILNSVVDGEIILAGAQLTSQSSTTVQNTAGTIMFRASHATNYKAFTGVATVGDILDGYLVGPSAWTPESESQYIPLADPPAVQQDPLSSWASVTSFGAVPIPFTDNTGAPIGTPTDSLAAFNAAFASGASTIYLPHGLYYISQNLIIPDTVKRIVGMNSTIRVFQGNGYQMNRTQGAFRLLNSTATNAPALEIENLSFDNSNYGTQLGIEHGSPRTLVVRDAFFGGMLLMNRLATGGPLFLSDTASGGKNVIAGTAPVTAVQLDMEQCGTATPCMTNAAADLNVLGIKTEGDLTVIGATGGRTQILGGLIYMVSAISSPNTPIFSATNAVLTASFVEEAYASNTHFIYVLSETNGGTTALTPEAPYSPRDTGGFGRLIPWLQTANH